ncbi:MAG TPA: aminotransferase class III-fold pyridoxal phosphate-dependent enzyme, partial [Vicinamibacteria bacterium]|nr:aminotransferase class III-fold pyridoxal phosphate-dependent enzyme [Vicinamibacteria bacterium]
GQAAATGEYLLGELRTLKKRYREQIVEVRGLGLLIGMEFQDTEMGYAVSAGLFRRGVLVAGTLLNAKTIRLEPALNIPRPLVDEVLEKLDDTLKELTR